jgi:hypothetical protein
MAADTRAVTCFKCNLCESWQAGFTEMKQHFSRRHIGHAIETVSGLEVAECARTGSRNSYIPTSYSQVPVVAADNFRTQSVFAQRSMFGVTVPPIDRSFMVSLFPPREKSDLVKTIRKQVKGFLEWIFEMCQQAWSCDLRNRMAPHGFKPIQKCSHYKYIDTLTAFVYFCRHCSWPGLPVSNEVGDIMWSVFSEEKTAIRMTYVAETFFFYSWHCMGRGTNSRDLAHISADCAYLKYGLRGGFLHYCLTKLRNEEVGRLELASKYFTGPGAFEQVRSLKNIAVSCMPTTDHQPVSWTPDSDFTSLTVLSVGVILTHGSIQCAFEKVLAFVKTVLDQYGVPDLSTMQFKAIQDDPTSTHAGQGLIGFNPQLFPGRNEWLDHNCKMDAEAKQHFFNDVYACANHIVVGLHLSAGPGFRGTEDASLSLVNSMSQAPRNFRVIGKGNHTQLCVIPVYSKQRPLSNKNPGLVAKFVPFEMAFLVVRFMFFMKTLEGRISGQQNNCATFLVTNCGYPVDAGSYNHVLNGLFRTLGLPMGIQDLRHALEAFARFLPIPDTQSVNPLLRNRLFANHSSRSSARYGRSDFTIGQVDADVLAEDEVASYIWNTVIMRHSSRLPDKGGEFGPPRKKMAHMEGTVSAAISQDCSSHAIALRTPCQLSVASRDQGHTSPFSSSPFQKTSPMCQRNLSQFQLSVPSRDQGHTTPFPSSPFPETSLMCQLNLSQLQLECIDFIKPLREDSVVVIPTGSGKTRLVEASRRQDEAIVAISPFQKLSLQLMRTLGDQVFRWPLNECSELHCIANAKFIVVAIEHCEYNSAFIHFLQRFNTQRRIGRLFFDEIDQLLHAESPDYRRCLSTFWSFRSRLISMGIQVPLVGLTATLRQCDVSNLRELITGIPGMMPVFRRSCFRSSISFEMVWTDSDPKAQQLCSDASSAHAEIVGRRDTTIVFATNLNAVQSLAAAMNCQAVTSGVLLDAAIFEKSRVIAASSCAGHGLHITDVTMVSVLGVPFDAETLLQWAGRIRESGSVKIFLNEKHVTSLSRRQDRRGELARVFLQNKGLDPQQACCSLIDCCKDAGSSMLAAFSTQEHQKASAQMRHVETSAGGTGPESNNTQQTQIGTIASILNIDNVIDLKYQILSFLSSIPASSCKVCHLLGDRTGGNSCGDVCRKFSGLCIRCFGRHSYRDCKKPRFAMPVRGLCYKCFLPFEKGIGPDMHAGRDIGARCTTSMCDILPRLAAILFYSNSVHIPQTLHGDFQGFLSWAGSVDKKSGVPGILKLLKALMP